jgi:hypothetical protein
MRMIGSSMATGCDVTESDVIKHHVTGTEVITCACTTGSCAISALLGPIHMKRQTSHDPEGIPLEW